MPVIRSSEAVDQNVHGSTFSAYIAPSRGSSQLCAWRLTVPAGLKGAAHRPTREEVVLLLDGDMAVTLDGVSTLLRPGDMALVPAGTEFRVDGGASVATAWVTTTPGLEAIMADGTRITPLWAT